MFNLVCGKSDKKNSGFSLVELIVAIGILAVISTIVAFMMTSSSRNYGKISVETQLQSEAQLVANAISEYAIDSYDAKGKSDDDIGSEYVQDEDKLLLLNSTDTDKVTDVQYVIARSGDKLYIGERRKDQPNPSDPSGEKVYGSYSFSLLGNHITDFTVDVSHVETDNIIDFVLSYEKNNRTYNGKYQVLMRNRAYADKEKLEEDNDDPVKMVLGLSPKHVYVDIVDGKPGSYYYLNDLSGGNRRTLLLDNYRISLNATVASNKSSINNEVAWKMFVSSAEDASTALTINGFSLNKIEYDENGNPVISDLNNTGVMSSKAELFLDNSGATNYDNITLDEFCVSVAKSVTYKGETYSAASKTSKIHLRRVKEVTLTATSGATSWQPIYDAYDGAVSSSQAMGYCYPDQYGRYQSMVLTASVKQKWVPYGEGIDWKIYKMDDKTKKWVECKDSKFATLQTDYTATSMNNTVNFGNSVRNGQLYRVTAASRFDPSKKAEYIFGALPKSAQEGGGYNSRGFYVNLNEYFEKVDFPGLEKNGDPAGLKEHAKNNDLYIRLASQSSSLDSAELYLKEENGQLFLYMDYNSFQYSEKKQKVNLYNQGMIVEMYIYSSKEKYDEGKADLANPFYYLFMPVYVHKEVPNNDPSATVEEVMLIPRGSSKVAKVKMDYYNLISKNYLGIYVDNDTTGGTSEDFGYNLNGSNFDTNPYIRIDTISSYGDVNHFVDNMIFSFTAKDSLVYASNPLTVRITADDYYQVCEENQKTVSVAAGDTYRYGARTFLTSPCTDYTVYIANVLGRNTFLSTPATSVGPLAFPKTEVKKATKSNPYKIKGYQYKTETKTNSSGTQYEVQTLVEIEADAYMEGSKYVCNLGGVVYTYNPTYQFWSN